MVAGDSIEEVEATGDAGPASACLAPCPGRRRGAEGYLLRRPLPEHGVRSWDDAAAIAFRRTPRAALLLALVDRLELRSTRVEKLDAVILTTLGVVRRRFPFCRLAGGKNECIYGLRL